MSIKPANMFVTLDSMKDLEEGYVSTARKAAAGMGFESSEDTQDDDDF